MPKIAVENPNTPGRTTNLDAGMYLAMRTAVLGVVPRAAPGMTPAEIIAAVKPILPEEEFPGGQKAGWWVKAVQLDLEAKGILQRAKAPPVRLWRTDKPLP